jgi:hypothetical protein
LNKRLFLIPLIFFCLQVSAQELSVSTLLELTNVPVPKFESLLIKKGYGSSVSLSDTGKCKTYSYKSSAKKKNIDTSVIVRKVYAGTFNTDFSFSYTTSSSAENKSIEDGLKKSGFSCKEIGNRAGKSEWLYQKNDITCKFFQANTDSIVTYNFNFRKQIFPKAKDILYAEDLSVFSSHEYLRFYFGEENVKRDVYYLSEKMLGKCSVLFPNTDRQIVFLWNDEVNNCKLQTMYIGGQLMSQSSLEYDRIVGENRWHLRSGVHAGMSLYALRKLNNAAFNIYGGNAQNTLMVFKDSTGKINFTRENIFLGCMNCDDQAFQKQKILNSDDAIADDRIIFVHTIAINVGLQ